MKSVEAINEILAQANGTDNYHKFSPFPGYPIATDGVIAIAEAAGCYWLLDVVGSYQSDKRLDPSFQVWNLSVNIETNEWKLEGFNDTELIITQKGEYTDFPLEKFTLWVSNGVILLPSEY